jgi:hypothetical protein
MPDLMLSSKMALMPFATAIICGKQLLSAGEVGNSNRWQYFSITVDIFQNEHETIDPTKRCTGVLTLRSTGRALRSNQSLNIVKDGAARSKVLPSKASLTPAKLQFKPIPKYAHAISFN